MCLDNVIIYINTSDILKHLLAAVFTGCNTDRASRSWKNYRKKSSHANQRTGKRRKGKRRERKARQRKTRRKERIWN